MKTFFTTNESLKDILADNGINLICNEKMEIVISDEDAAKIPGIIEEFARYAEFDYEIVERDKYKFICKTDLYHASRFRGFNRFTGVKVLGTFSTLKEANEAVYKAFCEDAGRCFDNWGLCCIYSRRPNDTSVHWAGTFPNGTRHYSCDIYDYSIEIEDYIV